jgi:NAD-dependent DNA ligase
MANDINGFRAQLRAFVAGHPHGWNHHEWLELLAELTDTGVDTTNPDDIGTALEQERILAFLEGLELRGLGAKRRDALAAHFGRLWDLKHACVDEIAQLPGFHQGLAEALHEALR